MIGNSNNHMLKAVVRIPLLSCIYHV